MAGDIALKMTDAIRKAAETTDQESAVDYSNAAKACSTKAAHPSKTRYLSLVYALIIRVRIEAQKGIVIGG